VEIGAAAGGILGGESRALLSSDLKVGLSNHSELLPANGGIGSTAVMICSGVHLSERSIASSSSLNGVERKRGWSCSWLSVTVDASVGGSPLGHDSPRVGVGGLRLAINALVVVSPRSGVGISGCVEVLLEEVSTESVEAG
jgi:hypothetical protein